MISDFRAFVKKFNVIPIAAGLVLALAFEGVVSSAVDILMSIVAKIGDLDSANFNSWTPGDIPVGALISAFISFLVVAWCVFLFLKALAKAGAETSSAATADQVLLTEIRDLLKKK